MGERKTKPPRDIWALAEKAQAEVDKWPAWKRRVADWALVTPPDRRTPRGEP